MVPRFSISSSPRHADARVGDGQRAGVPVRLDADRQLRIGIHDVAVGQQLELHPLQCIRCIGNELAKKDLAFGVEGVRQDIEQLLNFRAKLQGLRRLRLGRLVFVCHDFASLFVLREDRFTPKC